jgi:hypothetical protein
LKVEFGLKLPEEKITPLPLLPALRAFAKSAQREPEIPSTIFALALL